MSFLNRLQVPYDPKMDKQLEDGGMDGWIDGWTILLFHSGLYCAACFANTSEVN